MIDIGTAGGAQVIVAVVDTKKFQKLLEAELKLLGLTQLKVQNVVGLMLSIYQFNCASSIYIKVYTH